MDAKPPHPAWGIVWMVVGGALCIGGIIMLFTPGQGVITAALGVALFIMGRKVFRREYGLERIAREKAKKIARIEKHQEEKERRKREGKRPKPSIMIHYPEREQPGLESSVPVPEETESAPEGEHSDPESSVPVPGETESAPEGERPEKLIT